MGASEVEELVVRARPEGVDDTAEEIGGLEASIGETSDSLDDQGDAMQSIAQRWSGAMTAIVTGLAVAAAGLLSQVPVVGEAFAGLSAIISAVAFQMDQVLRPILQPVTDFLFDLSASIFEAEGAWGTLIGIVGTVIAILGTIIGVIASVGGALGGLAGAKAALVVAAKVVIGIITTLVSVLSLPVVAIAAVIAAVGLLVWYFRDEIVDAIKTAISWLSDFASGLRETITDLVSDAVDWGKDLIDKFIEGIRSRISDVRDAISDVRSVVTDRISFDILENDRMAERWGEDLMQHFSGGIQQGQREVERSLETPTPELDGGEFLAGGRSEIAVMLDGRRVDEGTRRFRGEEGSRRGRF